MINLYDSILANRLADCVNTEQSPINLLICNLQQQQKFNLIQLEST